MSDDHTDGRHTTIQLESGRTVASWLVLRIVCVGQFMVVLDASIVNVALPSIQRDLHFSNSSLQWIVNAYTLTFAGFLLLGGRAADLYGRRKIFLVGLGRLHRVEPPRRPGAERGVADRRPGAAGARCGHPRPGHPHHPDGDLPGGPGSGLGARRLERGVLGRRVGRCAARRHPDATSSAGGGSSSSTCPSASSPCVVSRRYLPESRAEMAHRHLDLGGAITVTAGLVALVFALVRTETYSWGSAQVLVPLALAVVLIAVFLFLQARVSKAPLVPLRIFRSRSVAGGNVVMFLLFGGAVRLLVLRDALHAARARLQPAPGGPGLPAPDRPHRRRRPGDVAPRAPVRAASAHPARHAGGRRRTGLARADRDEQHVRRRPPRALRPHRTGHGPGRHADRRGRDGGGAPARRPVWPPACSTRPAPSAPRSGWPHWRPSPPTAPRTC